MHEPKEHGVISRHFYFNNDSAFKELPKKEVCTANVNAATCVKAVKDTKATSVGQKENVNLCC